MGAYQRASLRGGPRLRLALHPLLDGVAPPPRVVRHPRAETAVLPQPLAPPQRPAHERATAALDSGGSTPAID